MTLKKTTCLSLFLLIPLLLVGCKNTLSTTSTTSQKTEVHVAAAGSLSHALTEIQLNYQKVRPDVKIQLNFDNTGSVLKQIEQGTPADLFLPDDIKQMDTLASKDLIQKQTRKNLLENRLVLIAPKTSTLDLQTFQNLTAQVVKEIAVVEPGTFTVGQYTQQVLKKSGIWRHVKGKIVQAKDILTVLEYVETGRADAGIVYNSDVIGDPNVKVIASASTELHQPIIYPAAILSGSKQAQAATDFLNYLSSPESVAIFTKHGFTMSKVPVD